jgi:hypothetical protein
LEPSTVVAVQAPDPPVGWLDVTTSPPPTATQRALLGHDTPSVPPPCTKANVQVAASVGLLEVNTLPLPSTATQKLLLGQDTPARPVDPSTAVSFQADGPAVGLVEVTTWPTASTATQRPLLGHETPFRKQGPWPNPG